MRRNIALVLTLCAGLVLLPGTAGAGTTFTFFGSGWGHGIGMSQYGALGLAQDGFTAGEIIRHYYRGSEVVERAAPLSRYRIGLLQDRRVVTLKASSGPFVLKLSNGQVIERVGGGGTRKVIIRYGQYRIRRGNGTLVGGHAWGSDSVHLRVDPSLGSVVAVAEWGHRIKRGLLEFQIVASSRAHLVVKIAPELYLRGIGEVPSLWPAAVLGAQAIAARTYADRIVKNLLADSTARARKWAACRCHLYGTPADQNYTGWDKEAESYGNRWVDAVQATRKRVATYGGSLITTYYSSSSGGHTENIENVWITAAPQPYLKGVCDPAEDETGNPYEFWGPVSRSGSGIASALSGYRDVGGSLIGNIGEVRDFRDFVRGVSGRVERVKVVGSNRSVVVAGWTLRGALALRDTRFSVDKNFNIRYRIRDKYDALSCDPGRAEGPQKSIGGGRFQPFQKGRLYFHSAKDVVTWIRGAILTKYVAKGAHGGVLGLPYRWRTIDGGSGRRAWFDNGQILWSAATGAHEVHEPVLGHYLANGAFSDYGYPITDVQKPDDLTRQSDFQKGPELRSIVCTRPDTESAWSCS
jgi:stage II sporulation protein D